jgi:two-component system, LuxR family, response regulator FixJ
MALDRSLIAVVDDDDGARLSAQWLLEGEGYRVLPFADGEGFLASPLLKRVSCALLDVRMRGLSGLDVLGALAEREDPPAAVMLTGHAGIPLAVAAMKLGAADFIEKPYKPEALVQAIAGATARWAARLRRGEARALVERLPARQRQVLSGIAAGRPNKVIAWEMGLSVRTVESYRAQLLGRLGVRSTAEAVRIALAAGPGGAAAPPPAL